MRASMPRPSVGRGWRDTGHLRTGRLHAARRTEGEAAVQPEPSHAHASRVGNEHEAQTEGDSAMERSARPSRRGLFLCSGLVLVVAHAVSALPRGREIVRNGDFSADATTPTHWELFGGGNFANFSLLPSPEKQKERILSVKIVRTSRQHWLAQLRQTFDEPVRKGELVYVTFEYKLTPGYGFQCYWQKELDPWPKYMSLRITEPAGEWRECSVACRAPDDIPARRHSLSLHLAEKTGGVEFRRFAVYVYPPSVREEDLTTTSSPVLGGDDVDRAWRTAAQNQIDSIRKGDLKLRVTHQGQPVPEASVTVRQTSRSFRFGTTVPIALFDDDALESKDFTELRNRLAGVEDRVEKYRNKVLDGQLFNMVAFRDALTWGGSGSPVAKLVPTVMQHFVENSAFVRGHSLYCPAFRYAPPRCRQMAPDELRKELAEHISTQVAAYKGTVHQWDVVHAPVTYHEMYDKMGEETLANAFVLARQADADVGLAFSDDRSLSSPTRDHMDEMLAVVAWLQSQNAPVQVIALEAHLGLPYIAPSAIEERLDHIAAATKLPIAITSLQVMAPSETVQAERIEDLMVLFFSHPAVEWICLGGIWEAEMLLEKAALFRRNFAIKPAGKVFDRLLREDWWTVATGKTAPDGSLTVRGFHGEYEVSAELGDLNRKDTVTLSGPAAQLDLDL